MSKYFIMMLILQLDLSLERLRLAVDDLLVKLAKTFPKPKLQTVFLINNYDMTISVLKVWIIIQNFSLTNKICSKNKKINSRTFQII